MSSRPVPGSQIGRGLLDNELAHGVTWRVKRKITPDYHYPGVLINFPVSQGLFFTELGVLSHGGITPKNICRHDLL